MKIQASNKSSFAPLRFQATRPWWKTIGKIAAKGLSGGASKRASTVRELHPMILKTVKESLGVRDPRVGQNESGLIQTFGGFMAGGRTIYELDESLTDSLAITDLNDATLEDLGFLAKETVYLHFGDHPFLNIDGIQHEGVFIRLLESEQIITIMAVKHQAFSKKPIHFTDKDDMESLPIFFKSKEETIASAIKNSRIKVKENNDAALAQIELIKQQYNAQGIDPDLTGALMSLNLPSEELYNKIATIALSTLCFLSARPEDVLDTWPSDAPISFVERATSSKDMGSQQNAIRALESDGYVKINYVGANYAASSDTVRYFSKGSSPDDVKRVISSHARRGHFKRQHYGPNSSQRKTIYVAPTIVNPGEKLGTGKILNVRKP